MRITCKIVLILMLQFTLSFSQAFASIPTISFQAEDNFPPFKFIQNNRFMGFEADLSNLIFRPEDYYIEYSTDIWENVYTRLKNGEIDTGGLVAVSEKRKSEVLFSKPVLKAYYAIYTKKDMEQLKIEDLKNYYVGVGRVQNSEELLKTRLNIMNYFSYTDIEKAIEALNRGEIQVLFESQEVVNYFLIKKGLSGEIVPRVTNLYPTEIVFGVSKKNPALVEYINRRMDELRANGIYEELYQKYFFTHSIYYNELRQKWLYIYGVIILSAIMIIFTLLHFYIINLKKKIYKEQGFSTSIVESANIFILIWKKDGALLKFNKYAQRVTGFSQDEVCGRKWMTTIIHESMHSMVLKMLDYNEDKSMTSLYEIPVLCKDSGSINIIWNNSAIYNEDEKPEMAVFMGIDITELKKAQNELKKSYKELETVYEELAVAEEELRNQYGELQSSKEALEESQGRYKLAVDGVNDGVWDFDFKTGKVFYSTRCKEMLGFNEGEVKDGLRAWAKYIHPEDIKTFKTIIMDHFEGENAHYSQELRLKTKDGGYKWILCRGKAVFDSDGKPVRAAGSLTDIDGRRKAEETIHNMAYYDMLTGLPNRTLLYERISSVSSQAARFSRKFAIIFMDLDNFKSINDTLGHDLGDKLLKNIADVLKENTKDKGILARLGGDEFVLLISKMKSIVDVTDAAEKILEVLQKPVEVEGSELYITSSMGIAIYPDDGTDARTLLKNADTAMYFAKETGKCNYRFYSSEMNDKIVNKANMEIKLRHAVKNNELGVFYQLQVDIQTGAVTGVEALARWEQSKYDFVSPDDFIPLAEETSLIVPIDEFVLKNACMQNKTWQDMGYPPVHVSVNISAHQFQYQNIIETIGCILDKTGMDPKWLVVEITESAALKDFDSTVKVINRLMEKGVQISLDDFGTGYSSLYYLKQLPINMLKIDKSFVAGITRDPKEENIINALIMLAHSMGIKVVAEGVETQEQLEFLRDKGCDIAQGFLFKKPMPPKDVEYLIKAGKL
ncbi:cyclic di-GMP phosphodiesterase Gmr [Oxobacter pfennigii]|uniref:Cyclic di-GMP phosphodiesterase Gmr n=1 Tax=Oxobacter pfennigii TaxID=36849 RepID=A0A0P8W2A0_9CLOT|nr:EAL domain-containing protein [Oxobacter pfennigii]KPU42653.1 cyclic di-GMP phosphodiesterase Gmr [Oxobacter pfennigii]